MVHWYHCINESFDEISYLVYIDNFLSKDELEMCTQWLEKRYYDKEFVGDTALDDTRSYGSQTRKQMWFQTENKYFCPKWKERYPRWESKEYDDTLRVIQDIVERRLKNHYIFSEFSINLKKIQALYREKVDAKFKFNSCLVNLYESGNEGISPHRDNIDSFGVYPTIVGLSIGATRHMKIQRIIYNERNTPSLKIDNNPDNKGLSMQFPLENNSVFIMMGASQKYYTHEIVKESTVQDKRFSFTFRHWIDSK